jgi:O-antigen ligase
LVVIFLPTAGITRFPALAGTWRGLYWHKNYLGAVMAFGNSLFLLSFWQASKRPVALGAAGFFYLLTLCLVVMSQSATGLIDVFLLHVLIAAYFGWVKWRDMFSRRALIGAALVSALVGLGAVLNLGLVFSLLGRTTGLTGRVPLWQYLISEMVSKRPWLGYGLETLWRDQVFWRSAGNAVGWGITVVNAHNGYMDILLYLGIIGLVLLLVVLIGALVRSVRSALQTPAWYGLLPLLILVYVLVTNISISYLIEFESWHWVLLVLVLFMTAPPAGQAAESPQPATSDTSSSIQTAYSEPRWGKGH